MAFHLSLFYWRKKSTTFEVYSETVFSRYARNPWGLMLCDHGIGGTLFPPLSCYAKL